MATVNATGSTTEPKMISAKDVGKTGKDDFMKLLLTQLRHQDPLKPMDDAQFIGQLTQFSILERLQEMAQFEQLGQANNLVGRSVEGISSESKVSVDGVIMAAETISGVVSAARMVNGKAVVVIGNKTVELGDIQMITESESTQMLRAAGMVGREVEIQGTTTSAPFSGKVSSASVGPDGPVLVVDGQNVPLSRIARVVDGDSVRLTDAAKLVGMEVAAETAASGYVVGVVDQIKKENGESVLVIDGRSVKPKEIISVSEGPDREG